MDSRLVSLLAAETAAVRVTSFSAPLLTSGHGFNLLLVVYGCPEVLT